MFQLHYFYQRYIVFFQRLKYSVVKTASFLTASVKVTPIVTQVNLHCTHDFLEKRVW